MSKFSENIKKYRTKLNFTQSELADRLYVTKQAVSKWETGRGYPDSALIPVIAKTLGVSIDSLMGEGSTHKRSVWIIVFISFVALVSIFISPIIIRWANESIDYSRFIEDIETTTGIEIPKKGTLVSADFEGWSIYGNTIEVSEMSYIIFKDSRGLDAFESDITGNEDWLSSMNSELLVLIREAIEDYTTVGDYYLLYNIDLNSFNDLSINHDIYSYIFLIYQLENHRLIIFKYSIGVEGE